MRIRRKLLLGAAFVAVLGIAGPLMGQAIDDVVEGVEIDGNIRFDGTETGALLDWAADDLDSTGCIVPDDGSQPPIADYGGNCGGEPDATFIVDQTTQGGNKDVNVFDAGKEHLPAGWTFKKGDAPAKDDIGNVYAWKQEAVSGDTIMYAAFERRVNNGDTHLDYELNQVTRLCPYSPGGGQPLGTIACPDRRAGDFILSFNLGPVTGGDFSDVVVELFQIVADGPDADTQGDLDLTPEFSILIDGATDIADLANGLDVSASIPVAICGGSTCPAQTLVIGVNSGGSIPAGPWLSAQGNAAGQSSVDVANFFEAAINLDNIGRGPSCPGAASLTIKSRSSSSITSDLKDTTLPVPFDLTNCGTIIIQKQTIGGDGTFGYTTTGGLTPATFNLTTSTNFASRTYTQVIPGAYTVTESTVAAGFVFKDLQCVDTVTANSTPQPPPSTPTPPTANIVVDANETVTCTFRNEQAQLKVAKAVLNACVGNANDSGSFDLRINGVVQKAGAKDGDSTPFVIVPTGSNGFDEVGASGTDLANYTKTVSGTLCVDASGGAGTISLAGGESKTCTITNVRKAKVTVTKIVSGTPRLGDQAKFNLKVGSTVVKADATSGQSGSTLVEVPAGGTVDVTVSELAGTGTSLGNYGTFIDCDNGDNGAGTSLGGITLQTGEEVNCIITNVALQPTDICTP